MKSFKNHQQFAEGLHDSSVAVEMLEARVGAVDQLAKELSQVGLELCQVLEEDQSEELADRMATFDDEYYTLIADFNCRIKELSGSKPGAQSQFSNGLKAPKIELPRFNGKIENWIKFRDLFISMVHSEKSLGSVVKFHHLINATKDIPTEQNVVSSFVFDEKNYESAWKALNDRFNDEDKLIQFHTDAINSVSKASVASSSELLRLIDSIAPHLCGLDQLGLPLSEDASLQTY